MLWQLFPAVVDAAAFSNVDKQKLVALVHSRKSSDDEDFAPVVAICKSHSSDIVECQGTAAAIKRAVTTSRPDDVWPDMRKFLSDAAKMKAKQRWAFVETHTVYRPLLILPVFICLSPVWLSVVSVLIIFQSSLSVHLIILPTYSNGSRCCAEKRAHVHARLLNTSQQLSRNQSSTMPDN